MFGELRMGRSIVLEGARDLASRIDDSVSRNPLALVSLARLKTADNYTYLHSIAVAGLMAAVARDLDLPTEQREHAAMAGLLHDMGKAHVPLSILNKPGALQDGEMATMRQHPARGEQILREAGMDIPDVLHVVRHHHERMDGAGYPDAL
ncbi:HD-GYP domain-containing protein, partial [Pseudoxanthomonas japonensis]